MFVLCGLNGEHVRMIDKMIDCSPEIMVSREHQLAKSLNLIKDDCSMKVCINYVSMKDFITGVI